MKFEKKIDHLIFDFDGTISDSYPLFVRFVHEIADECGFRVPCDDETLYRSLKVSWGKCYETIGGEQICEHAFLMHAMHQKQAQYEKEFSIFPEARDLLIAAKEKGIHNHIYTHSGPVVKNILSNMGVLELFDFILDSSYGFPSKPAPDALLFFLDKFGLDPKTCIMIGDRPIDAYAGMNAGMYGCLWDQDSLFADTQVDLYIKELSELQQILQL